MRSTERSSLFAVFAVVLITMATTVHFAWNSHGGNGWKEIVRSDVKGYYGYLTSLFIRHDMGHEPFAWEYTQRTPTGTLNKYFAGTAVTMAPAFFCGHAIALLDPEAPKDGHSVYEMKALSILGWIYLLVGLLTLRRTMLLLDVKEGVVAWTVLAFGLATPLLQYAAVQPGWSHIHSFAAISVFFLVIVHLHHGAHPRTWIVAGALFGLIVLIRPVNGLVLLGIPVLLGNGTWPLVRNLFAHPLRLAFAALACAAVLCIQPMLWHMQTGNWLEWGYRSEGFHWGRTEVLNVLFSIRRGLFVWSPVLLLAVLPIVLLWKKERTRSAALLIYWSANTYVIASWWIWYYGSGLGSRVYIDHYPVLAVAAGLMLQGLPRAPWIAARTLIVVSIALFAAQFVQYHSGVLHHEHMDLAKYKATFLRFGPQHRDRLGGKWEVPPFNPNGMRTVLIAGTDLERPSQHWLAGDVGESPVAFSGTKVCRFDRGQQFGTFFEATTDVLPTGCEMYLSVRVQCFEEKRGDSFGTLAILSVEHADGTPGQYLSFRMDPLPGTRDSTWRALDHRIPVAPLKTGDHLRFYYWNQDGTARFLLDDLLMRVEAVRPY